MFFYYIVALAAVTKAKNIGISTPGCANKTLRYVTQRGVEEKSFIRDYVLCNSV
jgi:hypothetical protein